MSKTCCFKRFLALFISFALLICIPTTSVMAAEPENAEETLSVISDYPNVGNLITEGSTTFSNNGTIKLHLNRSYSKVWIRVAAVNNPSNVIWCEFTAPNKKAYSLEFINGDGVKSDYFAFPNAPAGDYTFTFIGTSSGLTGAMAFMYEAY